MVSPCTSSKIREIAKQMRLIRRKGGETGWSRSAGSACEARCARNHVLRFAVAVELRSNMYRREQMSKARRTNVQSAARNTKGPRLRAFHNKSEEPPTSSGRSARNWLQPPSQD